MKLRSDKYLWNICMEIYREMYKKAIPSANFDKLIEKGITRKKDWFRDYYLSRKEQEKIINKYYKKYKCSRLEKEKIRLEMLFGCAPSSYLKKKGGKQNED